MRGFVQSIASGIKLRSAASATLARRAGHPRAVHRTVSAAGRLLRTVLYYDSFVEVLGSAFRHSVNAEDIHHALRNAVVIEEVDEDPARYLVLGPDRAGQFLELIVMDRPQGPAVMHAMPMRDEYRRLLQEGR